MKKKTELIKNAFIILLGKACTQFLSFLMLPLYTFVLSTDDYGTIDLISTYTALAIPIIGLQIEMGTFRYLVDAREHSKEKVSIVSNTFFTLLITTILSFIFLAPVTSIISLPHLWPILFSGFATIFSGYFLQIARGLGDTIGYSFGSIIIGCSSVVMNMVLLLVFSAGIDGILIATGVSNTICIIFLIFREKVFSYIDIRQYKKERIMQILHYSIPLIPNSVIWWIISVSDRTIITYFLNTSANGIYAVSNKFSYIVSHIYGVFNLSWTESASLHINDSDRDEFFSDTFNTTIRIFSSISLLMLAYMPVFFKFMIGKEYQEAYLYIPILSIGMIFNIVVSFIGSIYIAKMKSKEVALSSFWSGVLNISINVLLIKYIGLWAASISTLLAFLIMSVYRYYDVQKYVRLKIDKKLLMYLVLLFTIDVLLYYLGSLYAYIANVIIISCSAFFLNKSLIVVSIKKAKDLLIRFKISK